MAKTAAPVKALVDEILVNIGHARTPELVDGDTGPRPLLDPTSVNDENAEPTPVESTDVEQLAKEILEEMVAAERAERSSLHHAIRAGELLSKAKSSLKHGEWFPFLKRHEISKRTAQRNMRLAEFNAKGRLDLNAPRVAFFDLSIRAAEELLSTRRKSASTVEADDGEPTEEPEDQDGGSVAVLLPEVPLATQPAVTNSEEDRPVAPLRRTMAPRPSAPQVILSQHDSPIDSGEVERIREDERTLPENEPELGYFARVREAFETVIDLCRDLEAIDLEDISTDDHTQLVNLAHEAQAAATRFARTISGAKRRAGR